MEGQSSSMKLLIDTTHHLQECAHVATSVGHLKDFHTYMNLSTAEETSHGPDAITSLSVEDESIDSADENGAGINLAVPRQMMCMAYMLPDDHP